VESKASVKDRVLHDHKVAKRLGILVETGQKLMESYEDPDGVRKQELEDISGDNVIQIFYERLKQLREFHRKYPHAALRVDPNYEIKLKVRFTAEEAHGKYLDLQGPFSKYLNMPHFEKCEYLEYLNKFWIFDNLSKEEKLRGDRVQAYRKYLEDLWGYIKSAFTRINPLVNAEKLEHMVEEEFRQKWEQKAMPGGWFGPSKEKWTLIKEKDAERRDFMILMIIVIYDLRQILMKIPSINPLIVKVMR